MVPTKHNKYFHHAIVAIKLIVLFYYINIYLKIHFWMKAIGSKCPIEMKILIFFLITKSLYQELS